MLLIVCEFMACLQNSSWVPLCSAAGMLQCFAQRWEHSVASKSVDSSQHFAAPMLTLAQSGVRPKGWLETIQDAME